MAIEIELLQSTEYFSGVNRDKLVPIQGLFREMYFDKGVRFLAEGDWSDYLYFIVSGLVKVYKTSPGGKEQVLHIAPPGNSLNDVS